MKIKSENKPSWESISVLSKEFKSYWSQWDQLEIINGVLYREWVFETNGNIRQLVLPFCWREEVLKLLHDDPEGGHFGMHKRLLGFLHGFTGRVTKFMTKHGAETVPFAVHVKGLHLDLEGQ